MNKPYPKVMVWSGNDTMTKPYPKVMIFNGGLKVLFMSDRSGYALTNHKGHRLKILFYSRECGVVLTNYAVYEKGFYDTRWNMADFNDCDDPIPELRYLFDGEKDTVSFQNNNLPLKRI